MDLEKFAISEIKKAVSLKRGLQTEIARRFEVETGTVSNWLNGRGKTTETFRRLAASMAGIDYDELVERYRREHINDESQHNVNGNNTRTHNQADTIRITNNAGCDLTPGMVFLCQQINKKEDPDHVCSELLKMLDKYD